MKEIGKRLKETILRYTTSGIEQQVDYEKFYLYSLITHSTTIEGSTVTEVENQLLFDEGIAAKGRSLVEQMMNVDLKNAYLFGLEGVMSAKPYTVEFLCELSAIRDVMMAQHQVNLESRILQYQNSVDDTIDDTVNDTVKPKDTASRLIAAIKEHPEYTYHEYAQVLGVGRATVARHIKTLNGTVIQRIGSDKDGYWKFIKD